MKRIVFMAIKRAVKPHILYNLLIEAEPLNIHYQALPGNEITIRKSCGTGILPVHENRIRCESDRTFPYFLAAIHS